MMQKVPKKAVIYCRVSSPHQVKRGDGLSSQESRNRDYCKHIGHEVVKVFKDDFTGQFASRPAMDEMMKYLKKTPRGSHVVVIDDINRFARGLEAHLSLRATLDAIGVGLESPSIEFGDDSDSRLIEHLLASVSQHARQKIQETTLHRMQERVKAGYWVFQAPWGYRYAPCPTGGKMLVRNEPMASIIQEAMEGFATGRFGSQVEVKRFLETFPQIPNKNGVMEHERVHQIMTQIIYAGYVAVPSWGIAPRIGKHEPLISLEMFNTIQERLLGKRRAPIRTDINADFPLRGHVCCASCGHNLTANWSKGTHKAYPYYICRTKGCPESGKSIPRAKIEGDFEKLLQSLEPSPSLIKLAEKVFRDLWEHQTDKARVKKVEIKQQIAELDKETAQLLKRLIESDVKAVVKTYESRIAEIEMQKNLLVEKLEKRDMPIKSFEESFRTAVAFLLNPCILWKSDKLEEKKMAINLTFPSQVLYHRNEGVRTAELSLPFKVLGEFFGLKKEMAHPERFERPTY